MSMAVAMMMMMMAEREAQRRTLVAAHCLFHQVWRQMWCCGEARAVGSLHTPSAS